MGPVRGLVRAAGPTRAWRSALRCREPALAARWPWSGAGPRPPTGGGGRAAPGRWQAPRPAPHRANSPAKAAARLPTGLSALEQRYRSARRLSQVPVQWRRGRLSPARSRWPLRSRRAVSQGAPLAAGRSPGAGLRVPMARLAEPATGQRAQQTPATARSLAPRGPDAVRSSAAAQAAARCHCRRGPALAGGCPAGGGCPAVGGSHRVGPARPAPEQRVPSRPAAAPQMERERHETKLRYRPLMRSRAIHRMTAWPVPNKMHDMNRAAH